MDNRTFSLWLLVIVLFFGWRYYALWTEHKDNMARIEQDAMFYQQTFSKISEAMAIASENAKLVRRVLDEQEGR